MSAPTLPTLASATATLAVTLDDAARAASATPSADPIATAAILDAAALVARAADLLSRTRARLDPAAAAAERAALAAFLERERPDLFAATTPSPE